MAAPTLVAPSGDSIRKRGVSRVAPILTSEDCSAGNGNSSTANGSKIYVHGIYDAFEIERNLNV